MKMAVVLHCVMKRSIHGLNRTNQQHTNIQCFLLRRSYTGASGDYNHDLVQRQYPQKVVSLRSKDGQMTPCALDQRRKGPSRLLAATSPNVRLCHDIPGVKERTLVAIKPDGVQRGLIGQIIKRFEQRSFRLVGLKMLQVHEELLAQHYACLHKQPFYPSLLSYMTSGPVVAMVWEGHNVVKSTRMLVGDTNPAQAAPGTLRGDFSNHISRNIVHASESPEVAQKEILLWFHSSELMDWESCDHSNIYHP